MSDPSPAYSPRRDPRSPGRFTSFSNDDPLARVMLPPPDETPEERDLRLQTEDEARRISEAIDESLRLERLSQKKKKTVKLLLLGQSESGTRPSRLSLHHLDRSQENRQLFAVSTLCGCPAHAAQLTFLPEFQRLYTPSAFREERILWRSVIQLNLVRSIRIILENIASARGAVIESLSGNDDSDIDDHPCFSPGLDRMEARLLPLRHIEALLIAKLVPPNEDEVTDTGFSPSSHQYYGLESRQQKEVSVRSGVCWKRALAKGKSSASGRPLSAGNTGLETPDEATVVLYQCRHDMLSLWHDPTVQDILRRRKVRLEEQPGL